LSLPAGVFLPYSGVKTNVLFFDRKGSTSDIYYYEVNPPYKLTKNKPILYEHFKEFLDSWKERKLTDNSWIVQVNDIKEYDISAKNPNSVEVIEHKAPLELVESIKENSIMIDKLMDEIEEILKDENDFKYILEAREARKNGEKIYSIDETIKEFK
jgi:type I restriction enzyme M protein